MRAELSSEYLSYLNFKNNIVSVAEKQSTSGSCGHTYFIDMVNALGGDISQSEIIEIIKEKKGYSSEVHGLDIDVLLELLHTSFSGVYEKENASNRDLVRAIDIGNPALLLIMDRRGESPKDPVCSHYLLVYDYAFDSENNLYFHCIDSSNIVESSAWKLDSRVLDQCWYAYNHRKYEKYMIEINIHTYKLGNVENIAEYLRANIQHDTSSRLLSCVYDRCCSVNEASFHRPC